MLQYLKVGVEKIGEKEKRGKMKTYINLTNGLEVNSSPQNVLRIQSTKCEQKLWQDVIDSLPDDLLWELVNGRSVTIIDNSEKPRISRALWQGAALGYFCLIRSLGEELCNSPYLIYPRGKTTGLNVFLEFYHYSEYLDLGRYKYYRKFYRSQGVHNLGEIICKDKGFVIAYTMSGNKLRQT